MLIYSCIPVIDRSGLAEKFDRNVPTEPASPTPLWMSVRINSQVSEMILELIFLLVYVHRKPCALKVSLR